MRNYLTEFIGTFALVFFAAGAAVINEIYPGQLGLKGCAAASGLIVVAIIYAFGNISGAHVNPAVTIGFSLAGLFSKKEILPYVASQLSGSIAAGFFLKFLFPATTFVGATLPSGIIRQAFSLEIVLSFFLMLIILHTSQGIKEIQQLAGFIIGGLVMLEILIGGPVSGGSMNPARSLGPLLASGNADLLWIYFIAPVIGAGLGTLVWKVTKPDLKI